MERTKLNYVLKGGVPIEILIDFEDGLLFEVYKKVYIEDGENYYEYTAGNCFLDSCSHNCNPHKINFDIEYIMDLWKSYIKAGGRNSTDFLCWSEY